MSDDDTAASWSEEEEVVVEDEELELYLTLPIPNDLSGQLLPEERFQLMEALPEGVRWRRRSSHSESGSNEPVSTHSCHTEVGLPSTLSLSSSASPEEHTPLPPHACQASPGVTVSLNKVSDTSYLCVCMLCYMMG